MEDVQGIASRDGLGGRNMLRIGCHISSAKGFLAMGKAAESIGATCFQFFTRNPRGGNARKLDVGDVEAMVRFCGEKGIGCVLAHAPYLSLIHI